MLTSGGKYPGDNIRFGLNKNLGFSQEDRQENIRRIAEVAKLFSDSSTIAITSFISPYAADRNLARKLHEDDGLSFVEVHVDIPIDVAEQRDPKGLYKKARAGQIKDFTGVSDSAPYEKPDKAEVYLDTSKDSVEEGVVKIIKYLEEKNLVKLPKPEGI